MTSTAPTPAQLLRAEVRRDGARPLLTFYDDATGERVEVSATTFDNWVAKTAGLLSDGLDAEAGSRVAVLLPAHWQALAWAGACWTLGACVVTGAGDAAAPGGTDAHVAVAGPDTLDAAAELDADDVIALSLRPLGGRFTEPLPAGVLDYAAEVPSFPDHFVPITPPEPDEPALDHGGIVHTLTGLVARANDRAEHLGAQPGARLLVATDDLHTALVDALLVPLVIGGSAVLVRHENPAGRDARITAERVTAVTAGPESTPL